MVTKFNWWRALEPAKPAMKVLESFVYLLAVVLIISTHVACSRKHASGSALSSKIADALPNWISGSTNHKESSLGFSLQREGKVVGNYLVNINQGSYLFDASDLEEGDYILIARPPAALRKKIEFHYNPQQGVRDLDLIFHFGDLDGNNVVDSDEVAFVAALVGTDLKSGAVPSIAAAVNPRFIHSSADLNGDHRVDGEDLKLVTLSLGKRGD